MRRDVMEFTELEVPQCLVFRELNSPKYYTGPWPQSWQLLEVDVETNDEVNAIYRYLVNFNKEKFGLMPLRGRNGRTPKKLVIAFQNGNDALMFRLSGGEKAWELDEIRDLLS